MSDRQAALEQALKQIEKQFGKGSIMKLGEKSDLEDFNSIQVAR